MHRFWDVAVRPVLEALDAPVVIEIGSQHGEHSRLLMAHLSLSGGTLHVVEPEPQFDVEALVQRHGDAFVLHRHKSLSALSTIPPAELVLIDGDHNWYTVFHELCLLERIAHDAGSSMPLVMLHDIAWPYGRRDLYYAPDDIPGAYQQPYRRAGLRPGKLELQETGGLNAHLCNALHEHSVRNGVLTAVEDFVAQADEPMQFLQLGGLHGLGVIAGGEIAERPAVRKALSRLTTPASLARQNAEIERDRLEIATRLAERTVALTESSEALEKVRSKLTEHEAALADTRSKLSAARELADERGRMLAKTRRQDQQRRNELATAYAEVERHRQEVVAATTRHVEVTKKLADAGAAHESIRRTLEASVADRRQALERAVAAEGALGQAQRSGQAATADYEQLLEQLRGHVTIFKRDAGRVEQSRSWRLGHATMRLLRRLAFRPPKGSGAMVQLVADAKSMSALLSAEPKASGLSPNLPKVPPATTPVPQALATHATNGDGADPRALLAMVQLSSDMGSRVAPPRDLREVVVNDGSRISPSVDIVVCVHDALEDVDRCLRSLLKQTSVPFRLIVVDDGSTRETAEYLDELIRLNPRIDLKRNSEPPHGYTIAANIGLRASSGNYVVLLNSDTIVTRGWIESIVELGEADSTVGIIGPLSNAASHQSVPELKTDGDWAVNQLPNWLTEDGMASVIAHLPCPDKVTVPFLNGFCYVIRRAVIDSVGFFDEETFGGGYSEENDYSRRAAAAGFELAVCPRAYVFHAKSRSYGHAERRTIAKAHYRKFLDKHGEAQIRALVADHERDPHLAAIRARVGEAVSDPARAIAALPALSVCFVLPGLSAGGSGGAHSVYQEVSALRSLGVDARIALAKGSWNHAVAAYQDAEEIFVAFQNGDDLAAVTRRSDVLVATHYKSAALVAEVARSRPELIAAYYLQDYEPLFSAPDSRESLEARRSYTSIPGVTLFAKTRWLCDLVSARHGIPVAKVEPSLDTDIFHARGRVDGDGRVRVAAMLRPRTPRRAPGNTLSVLRRLAEEHGDQVTITTFGCEPDALTHLGGTPAWMRHLGLLSRSAVADLLRSTDIFLDCSWYQAFGRTGLEAMACGAMAVMPRAGAAQEIIRDGDSGILVDTADVVEMTRRIGELVTDSALLTPMQAAARRRAGRYSGVRAALSEYVLFAESRSVSRRSS